MENNKDKIIETNSIEETIPKNGTKADPNIVYIMLILNNKYKFIYDDFEFCITREYDKVFITATHNTNSTSFGVSFYFKFDNIVADGEKFIEEYTEAFKTVCDNINTANNTYKQKLLKLKQMYQDEYEQACKDSAEDPCCEEYLFRQISYKEFIVEIDRLLEEG